MSAPELDGVPSTRREIIIARNAFERGCWTALNYAHLGKGGWPGSLPLAKARYPLPKVTRPRVVPDPHGIGVLWTVRAGSIRPHVDNAWGQKCVEKITPERVAVWADLLANPTEEVEADQ